MVLGEACGTGTGAVEHWAPGATTSTLHDFDAEVRLRTITATETGDLWVAGSQRDSGTAGGHGYVARYDGARFISQNAPPGETISLAVAPSGELWAVVESFETPPDASATRPPNDTGPRRASVWRFAGGSSAWQNVVLPPIVGVPGWTSLGAPRWIEASADRVWLGTENALLLHGSDEHLSQPPARTALRGCSVPLTNAQPFVYRRVSEPVPLQVKLHGYMAGPNCPDFFLVERTRESKSEQWERVARALASERGHEGDAVPVIAFELGYYFFGFKASGTGMSGQTEYAIHDFLKTRFPEVKEVCGDPIPVNSILAQDRPSSSRSSSPRATDDRSLDDLFGERRRASPPSDSSHQ